MTKPINYDAASIGLFGLDNEFKLAHLPFLVFKDVYGVLALEGSSGTAKTTLAKRLGLLNDRVTGGGVGVYSADKVQYQDFYGIPIPNMEEKVMDLFGMKNAMARKELILVDELNRATYENQEKFLSLFASREIDGHEVDCKYMYVAMNPIMGETGDEYEGTQPVDKALGERVMMLIKMPRFSSHSVENKLKVIQACNNQTSWEPTDDLVSAHREFIEVARAKYEEIKGKYSQPVAEYICEVENWLERENSGFQIEGRRAQFILTNILGVFSLDFAMNGSASLEDSALQALLLSFPDTLWRRAVNNISLSTAHKEAKHLLTTDTETRLKSVRNSTNLDRSIDEIVKASKEGQSLESVSKLIIQNWPDKKTDPAGHYIYSFGMVVGLHGSRAVGKALKENEYQRLKSSFQELVDTSTYRQYLEWSNYYKANLAFPSEYSAPDYILSSVDPNASEQFSDSLQKLGDTIAYVMAMGAVEDIEILNYDDFVVVVSRISKISKSMNSIIRGE